MTSIRLFHSTHIGLYRQFLPNIHELISYTGTIIDRVSILAQPYFKIGTAIFFGSIGIKEIYYSICPRTYAHSNPRIKQLCSNKLKNRDLDLAESRESQFKLKTHVSDYWGIHGTLFIGAGVCDALMALQYFNIIDVSKHVSKVSFIGNICFIFANIISLNENLTIYLGSCSNVLETKHTSLVSQSALLGLINNIAYIFATALTLFDIFTAVTMLMFVLALHTGAVKIFFDFYIAYTERVS